MIAVLQAAERGEMEFKHHTDVVWRDFTDPTNVMWDFFNCEFRIKPKPRMVPLGPEDVPPGSAVRGYEGYWCLVSMVDQSHGVMTVNRPSGIKWQELMDYWQISRDGGKTWQRCEKEAKE